MDQFIADIAAPGPREDVEIETCGDGDAVEGVIPGRSPAADAAAWLTVGEVAGPADVDAPATAPAVKGPGLSEASEACGIGTACADAAVAPVAPSGPTPDEVPDDASSPVPASGDAGQAPAKAGVDSGDAAAVVAAGSRVDETAMNAAVPDAAGSDAGSADCAAALVTVACRRFATLACAATPAGPDDASASSARSASPAPVEPGAEVALEEAGCMIWLPVSGAFACVAFDVAAAGIRVAVTAAGVTSADASAEDARVRLRFDEEADVVFTGGGDGGASRM